MRSQPSALAADISTDRSATVRGWQGLQGKGSRAREPSAALCGGLLMQHQSPYSKGSRAREPSAAPQGGCLMQQSSTSPHPKGNRACKPSAAPRNGLESAAMAHVAAFQAQPFACSQRSILRWTFSAA